MSKVAIVGNASGTGTFTIAAPNSNSDYTLTLPAQTGTVLTGSGAIGVNASAPTDSVVINSSGNVGIGGPVDNRGGYGRCLQVSGTEAAIELESGSDYGYLAQNGTSMQFRNVANGNTLFYTNNTERMRIDSSGNLLVGTTSANGILTVSSAASNAVAATIANTSASPYGLLTDFTSDPNNATNYGYKFRLTNNTNIYTIFSNGTTSARSDERFKKDIETTRNGYVEDLTKLRVVKYRWQNAEQDSPKELGFIAQEVEKVFPGLISTEINDDGIDVKSIKTSVFIPMLVKAIQELSAKNDALEARIAALEGAANVPT